MARAAAFSWGLMLCAVSFLVIVQPALAFQFSPAVSGTASDLVLTFPDIPFNLAIAQVDIYLNGTDIFVTDRGNGTFYLEFPFPTSSLTINGGNQTEEFAFWNNGTMPDGWQLSVAGNGGDDRVLLYSYFIENANVSIVIDAEFVNSTGLGLIYADLFQIIGAESCFTAELLEIDVLDIDCKRIDFTRNVSAVDATVFAEDMIARTTFDTVNALIVADVVDTPQFSAHFLSFNATLWSAGDVVLRDTSFIDVDTFYFASLWTSGSLNVTALSVHHLGDDTVINSNGTIEFVVRDQFTSFLGTEVTAGSLTITGPIMTVMPKCFVNVTALQIRATYVYVAYATGSVQVSVTAWEDAFFRSLSGAFVDVVAYGRVAISQLGTFDGSILGGSLERSYGIFPNSTLGNVTDTEVDAVFGISSEGSQPFETEAATVWIGNATATTLNVTGYGQRRLGQAWSGVSMGGAFATVLSVTGRAGLLGANGVSLDSRDPHHFNVTSLEVFGWGGGENLTLADAISGGRCGISLGVFVVLSEGSVELFGAGGNGGVRADGICSVGEDASVVLNARGDIAVEGTAGEWVNGHDGASGIRLDGAVVTVVAEGELIVSGRGADDLPQAYGHSDGILMRPLATIVLVGDYVEVSGTASRCSRGHNTGVTLQSASVTIVSHTDIDINGDHLSQSNTTECFTIIDEDPEARITGGVQLAAGSISLTANFSIGIRGEASHINDTVTRAFGVSSRGLLPGSSLSMSAGIDIDIRGIAGYAENGHSNGIELAATGLVFTALNIDMYGRSGRSERGDHSSGIEIEAVSLTMVSNFTVTLEGDAHGIREASLPQLVNGTLFEQRFPSVHHDGLHLATGTVTMVSESVRLLGNNSVSSYCTECNGVFIESGSMFVYAQVAEVIGVGATGVLEGYSNHGVYVRNVLGGDGDFLMNCTEEVTISGVAGHGPRGRCSGVFIEGFNTTLVGETVAVSGVSQVVPSQHATATADEYGENMGVQISGMHFGNQFPEFNVYADVFDMYGVGGNSTGDGRNHGVFVVGAMRRFDVNNATIVGEAGSSVTTGKNVGVKLELRSFDGLEGNGRVDVRGRGGESEDGAANSGVEISNDGLPADRLQGFLGAQNLFIFGEAAASRLGSNAGVLFDGHFNLTFSDVDVIGLGAASISGGQNYGVRIQALNAPFRLFSFGSTRIEGVAAPSESGEANVGVSALASHLHLESVNDLVLEGTAANSTVGGLNSGVELVGVFNNTATDLHLFSRRALNVTGYAAESSFGLGGNSGVVCDFDAVELSAPGVSVRGFGARGYNGGSHGVIVKAADSCELYAIGLLVEGDAGAALVSGEPANGISLQCQDMAVGADVASFAGQGGAGPVDSAGVHIATANGVISANATISGVSGVNATVGAQSYGVFLEGDGGAHSLHFTSAGTVIGANPPSNITGDYHRPVFMTDITVSHSGDETFRYLSPILARNAHLRAVENSTVRVQAEVTGYMDVTSDGDGEVSLEVNSKHHHGLVRAEGRSRADIRADSGCEFIAVEEANLVIANGVKVTGPVTLNDNSTFYPGGINNTGCVEIERHLEYNAFGVSQATTVIDTENGGNVACVNFDRVTVRDALILRNNTLVVNPLSGTPSGAFRPFVVNGNGFFRVFGKFEQQLGDGVGGGVTLDVVGDAGDGNYVELS